MTATVRKKRRATYAHSVFINCPFDDQYRPLFRALIFTVQDCGFFPRCALEADDSGEARATKIIRLIRQSQFGIHDISRTELSDNGLPRFNMPYELGIFVGFKYSGAPKQDQKRLLILDRQPYRYQQFLSDIAGQDIRSHDNREETLIHQVRHWLRYQTNRSIPGVHRLFQRFTTFQAEIPDILARVDQSEADLANYYDFQSLVAGWIAAHP